MIQNIQQKKRQKGFTLIELMIVIAIIGILAAIAVPQFMQYRMRGVFATVVGDAKNVHTAVVAWKSDNPTADDFPGVTVKTTNSGVGNNDYDTSVSRGNSAVIGVDGTVNVTNPDLPDGTFVQITADGNTTGKDHKGATYP